MKTNNTNQTAEKLFAALAKICEFYGNVSYYGLRRFKLKSLHIWINILFCLMGIFTLTYNYDFIVILHKLFPLMINESVMVYTVKVPWYGYFSLFTFLGLILSLPLMGRKEYRKINAYQRDLNFLSMKAGNGSHPKVIQVDEIDAYKTKLVVKSEGIGVDRYKTKINDLTSALGQIVEDIKACKNPKFIQFNLTRKSLPEKLSYYEMPDLTASPLTFNLGESLGGYLSQSLCNLPHMLIAGSTGGGKSFFFKQTLLSILKSTEKVQLYLIDLKKGVEMRPFEELPNVTVIKTEEEAVIILEKLKSEMDRRFDLLQKNKSKEINTKKDKLDKIIIGIDEASVLYTKVSSNSSKKNLINKARELTDELAKLSRAAGMHLILATQKVTKETIDTKVQENIGGRMCFRMNTLQGSMTVLGNKMAHELPDVKGRGLWACGHEFIQVQTPLLTDDELENELSFIASEYKTQKRKFFGPILDVGSTSLSKELSGFTSTED
ncbi:MAG: hypothetical protein HON90_13710 [Halobacteriovoraceae bacterium]|jgi:DNA segregation ATPase FtsK/SpoIIIE, S-DNA-T family|nr:hypothetical protein [Halobacteriovoraceae bacterium]